MKNIIGLCRVSTEEQGESRNGLEAQRKDIEKWASVNGYNLVSIIEEITSGSLSIEDRPVLQAALSLASKMKCKILVSKVDRISRDAGVIHKLMQEKKTVISVALGEQADSFVEHIYAGLAEKERKMISERTKAGLAAAKARGVILGNRTNIHVAQKNGNKTMMKKADEFALHLKDQIDDMLLLNKNYSQIADRLNTLGVKTVRNKQWHASTVSNLVARLNREGCKTLV
jgi:DNA invertase Pin-like site-specific DNA recombinase